MPASVLRWVSHSPARVGKVASAAGLAGGIAVWHQSQAQGSPITARKSQSLSQVEFEAVRLPPWFVSIISGAIGESVSQLLLYPVETIKVMAQQSGQGSMHTIRTLFQKNSFFPALSILFRGAGANIPMTMLIGASYLGVFQISTRAVSHLFPSDSSSESPPTASSRSTDEHSDPRGVVIAAFLASLVVALVSGPLDMARNRMQAGLVDGPLLKYTFSSRGLRDTIPYLGPFMMCSLPHDLAELLIYFQLSTLADRESEGGWLRRVASQEWIDAGAGAVAGAAGVLLSTPADCIKTKLITDCSRHRQEGARAQSGGQPTWTSIAATTIRRQGMAGLFVGVVPRMLDEVPGSVLHWVIAERCTRWLQDCKLPA